MSDTPEKYSEFYTESKLGFDLIMVEKGFELYRNYFTGSRCLELGPATGYMTRQLVNCFESVTAVEGSESLYSQIPDWKNLTKVNCLFEEFQPNGVFDTIMMNHVLEHIQEPVGMLKVIKNWLAPGGRFIIGVPNALSFHRLAAVEMGLLNHPNSLNERDVELGHYRVYDLALLRSHVMEAGWSIHHEGGIFLKFLPNYMIEKFLDSELLNAYFKIAEPFKENCAEIYIVVTH